MKKLIALIIVSLLLEGIVWAIPTDRTIIKDYTMAVEKAVFFLSKDGKDKAFAAVNDPKGEFAKLQNGLFVYVIDLKGEILSHSSNKLLIGQRFFDIRDADGKLFYQEIIKEATQKGSGWVTYKVLDPISKRTERKECYFKKSGDYIVACAVK